MDQKEYLEQSENEIDEPVVKVTVFEELVDVL